MISRRLMLAREAVRAFNDGWLDTISKMSAPDILYIDSDHGLTALGLVDFKRVAASVRRTIPGSLTSPRFDERGNEITVRSTVGDDKEFVEVIEFDDDDRIVKVTAHYGDLSVAQAPATTG